MLTYGYSGWGKRIPGPGDPGGARRPWYNLSARVTRPAASGSSRTPRSKRPSCRAPSRAAPRRSTACRRGPRRRTRPSPRPGLPYAASAPGPRAALPSRSHTSRLSSCRPRTGPLVHRMSRPYAGRPGREASCCPGFSFRRRDLSALRWRRTIPDTKVRVWRDNASAAR